MYNEASPIVIGADVVQNDVSGAIALEINGAPQIARHFAASHHQCVMSSLGKYSSQTIMRNVRKYNDSIKRLHACTSPLGPSLIFRVSQWRAGITEVVPPWLVVSIGPPAHS